MSTGVPRRAPWLLLMAVAAGPIACTARQAAQPANAELLPVIHATLVKGPLKVAEHMRAAIEMQLSGEPFAQSLGYSLTGFARSLKRTDQYRSPATGAWTTDPLGYALAVESYEYSKQPMNNLSFESGAGLSLMFGPVLNPDQRRGEPAYARLLSRFQQLAAEALASGSQGRNLIVSPAPSGNPLNFYGWPGLWPVFAEFSSFDPTIRPVAGAVNGCSFKGAAGSFGYGRTVPKGALIAAYECDYNSLNLPDRERQVTRRLEPDALGYATWKQALWVINYWQALQDTAGHAIALVAPGDVARVGLPGNTVLGRYPDPNDPAGRALVSGAPGVYLGDTPMEGWQGLTMLEEMDNKAALLLKTLLSHDGLTLSGAPSLRAADDYAYDSRLLYFPASIDVAESPTAPSPLYQKKYFPLPTSFSIADRHSRLSGLSGLLGGFGEAFAMTDPNNAQVGGSIPFQATFDGDPFPEDDGLPNGQETLHDRALGILKIALVDLDRLHLDEPSQVLVDEVDVKGGSVTRGTLAGTVELAEALVALRTAFRALNGTLQLYSNDTPDVLNAPAALDSAPLTGARYSGPLQGHVARLIRMEADFLSEHLVREDGSVANGYDVRTRTADPGPTRLEAEAAALRGLLEAYLATSDVKYRDRAVAVHGDLQRRFWMEGLRSFRTVDAAGAQMRFTPLTFALLDGALRQYHKLVAGAPGHAQEGAVLLARLKRLHKLVLNGWNDRNQDDRVDFPQECLGAGLQLGERALTGEPGRPGDDGDGDRDCVREISYVGLPAALGAELDLTL